MHFSKATLLNLLPAVLAAGTVHQVTVGPSNTLTFSPNTINAAAGDSVQFNFATQNHTVTSGNPNVGCSPNGQFYSGFVPAPGAANTNANANGQQAQQAQQQQAKQGQRMHARDIFVDLEERASGGLPSFTVQVQNTNPMVVYCSQAQHCQAGMVMVINPTQTGATSLVQYQRISSQAKTNVVPSTGVTGGTLANLVQGATGGTKASAAATKGNGNKGKAN